MIIYKPYTYLIGWSRLDRWYYGSETGKTKRIANPQNLWTTYFTSSKHVKQFREQYGEPDITEIRQTFTTKEQAIKWETKVLIRLDAANNERWLNKKNSPETWVNKGGYKLKETQRQARIGSGNGFYGKHHSSELIERWKINRKGKNPRPIRTQEERNNISKNTKGKKRTPEQCRNISLGKLKQFREQRGLS